MIRNFASAALACSLAAPSHALDGVSLEAGRGSDELDPVRAAAQWEGKRQWFSGHPWHVGYYWELSFGNWTGEHGKVLDFGLTPVFRLEKSARSPYFEVGVGGHILSDVHVSRDTDFSTRFQFGDHIGAGVRLGDGGRYELGLRLQHYSNGGLRDPNPGANFLLLRLRYRLR